MFEPLGVLGANLVLVKLVIRFYYINSSLWLIVDIQSLLYTVSNTNNEARKQKKGTRDDNKTKTFGDINQKLVINDLLK